MSEEKQPEECKCPTCGAYIYEEIVELSPAYMWDCPNCGRENFQRVITTQITDEDRIEMDLPDGDYGCWQSYPCVVVCRHCNKQFGTRSLGEDEDADVIEDE